VKIAPAMPLPIDPAGLLFPGAIVLVAAHVRGFAGFGFALPAAAAGKALSEVRGEA
jgi:hypothetical protein